jgi:HEPN domain-containing protein
MMDETIRGLFLLWVQRSFRDVADRDYLSARLLYKHKLFQASVWYSLQAVEKYLKSILLFSYKSTKKYKHKLPDLWQAIEKLPRLKAEIPSDCIEFLEYLTTQGANRYLDYPLFFQGYELFKLDRCIWHVRRYCQDFCLLPGVDDLHPGEFENMLAAIPREATAQAVKTFRIPYGYLESLLADMGNPLRAALVWKNAYYGKYKKHNIRFAPTASLERPVYMTRPELLSYVEEVADIPQETLNELRKYRDEKLKEKTA